MRTYNPNTVFAPTGPFSHGVEAPGNQRWLYISGQVGVTPDGKVPAEFAAQAEQCWRNIKAVLAAAEMSVFDLVKCTHFLTRAEDVATYGKVRARELGEARPASTLLVISALARPGLLVEVEAIAAKRLPPDATA
jgi:2-iminobutanoate/2-iminopropanoate deaminase